MKDFRITVTIRNNRLLSAIEDAGYDSALKFASSFDIPYAQVLKYLGLKLSPIKMDGTIRPDAELICDALGKNLHEIFPERFMDKCLERNSMNMEMDQVDFSRMITGPEVTAQRVIESDARRVIDAALEKLKPLYKAVLIRHYCLDGEPAMTLKEIGKMFNISQERVRQMVLASERKLLHPSNSGPLRAALETLKL